VNRKLLTGNPRESSTMTIMKTIVHLGVAVALITGCAFSPPLETGAKAASRFVYLGQPVHPLCVRFSLEKSSIEPNDLSSCSRRAPATSDQRGWLAADFPPGEGRGNVAYRALAAKGDRFLIAEDYWGGGTGQWSFLLWVRLANGKVTKDRDELGGDRCVGGMSDFTVDGTTVHFKALEPTTDILKLAGVAVSDSLRGRLRSSYPDCDGVATYVYDAATDKTRFTSLTLLGNPLPRSADAGPAPPHDPQVCFDSVARQYVDGGKQTLTPAALQEFGRTFSTRCGAN
jgi:hypothetical protein